MNSLKPIELWRRGRGDSKQFNEIVNSVQFRMAVTHAIAEYQREAASCSDGTARLLGANAIIDKLMNMGEENVPRRTPSFNLPHPEA